MNKAMVDYAVKAARDGHAVECLEGQNCAVSQIYAPREVAHLVISNPQNGQAQSIALCICDIPDVISTLRHVYDDWERRQGEKAG